jgi:hypothetical protein
MRQARIALITLLCLPLVACFEEPVTEHLHLTFHGDGTVIATVVQEIAPSDRSPENRALADRLEESREALEYNLDPWSQRFANLEPLAEHQSIERVEGELLRWIHSAVFGSFDIFLPLVEADGLTGNLAGDDRVTELSLFPTGGSRATYSQRQEAERRLGEWADQLAEYFASAHDLYDYLDRRPDRAVHCFAHVFDRHEGLGETGPLSPTEEELVVQVKEAMEWVAAAILVPDDDAFSLNELSRLVYDPFPTRLTIAAEAEALSAVGFVERGGFFERPAVDAWNALRSLEGRWISPDLVTAAAAPAPDDQQPEPDVLMLASTPRYFSSAPTSAEVEAAIFDNLVPEDMLQLRWPTAPRRDDIRHREPSEWLDLMAAAEAHIPD